MDQEAVRHELLRGELLRLQQLIGDSEYCHDALVDSRIRRVIDSEIAMVLVAAQMEIARAHKLAAAVKQLLHSEQCSGG